MDTPGAWAHSSWNHNEGTRVPPICPFQCKSTGLRNTLLASIMMQPSLSNQHFLQVRCVIRTQGEKRKRNGETCLSKGWTVRHHYQTTSQKYDCSEKAFSKTQNATCRQTHKTSHWIYQKRQCNTWIKGPILMGLRKSFACKYIKHI